MFENLNSVWWVKLKVFALAACMGFITEALSAETRGITLAPRMTPIETPYVNGVYRALIIGNDHYRDPERRWPALRTAVTDARAVAQILAKDYGFSDVQLLENATRRETLQALSLLSKRVLPRDSVLIYYAGHGWLDAETDKGYWVPVDGVGADHTTFMRNSTIRDELSTIAARSQHALLISDSCFSGTLLRRGTRGINPTPEKQRFYKNLARKKSVQILAAGGLEYVDDDYRDSGHSPFTYFLLNELRLNDRPLITASELSTNVQKAVSNNSDQTPERGVLQGAGDELGEFIFLNVNISVEGVPRDQVKVKITLEESAEQQGKASDSTRKSPGDERAIGRVPIPLPTL